MICRSCRRPIREEAGRWVHVSGAVFNPHRVTPVSVKETEAEKRAPVAAKEVAP